MKILICSDIYPGLAGIAQYCQELSNVLKREHQVTILTSKQPLQKKEEILNEIKIIRLPHAEVEQFMQKNKKNFNLVIIRWYRYLLPATQFFENTIYILPSIRKASYKSIYTNLKKREIEKSNVEEKGMQKCKFIIYPSKNVKKQAKEEYGINRGEIISHAVNLEKFKPSKEKKIYDILTVANLSDKRKGIDKLIKVAKNSQANFFVLGKGKLREEYEKEIKKENIKNFKFLGQKESQKYYPKSKIYVLPSRYEAFGLVLLEAMACGIPCIAFQPDGKKIKTASDEIIINKKTGFLVKNEKEMAKKINLLLSKDKLRKKMGKAARKKAEKNSWEKKVKQILNLFQ